MGERLTVQFARGPRHKDTFSGGPPDRNNAPRPRRTIHRMQITGLPGETSWQVSSSPFLSGTRILWIRSMLAVFIHSILQSNSFPFPLEKG
jgi:hypothetical protein